MSVDNLVSSVLNFVRVLAAINLNDVDRSIDGRNEEDFYLLNALKPDRTRSNDRSDSSRRKSNENENENE